VQIGQLMATVQLSDKEKPIEDNVGTQPIQPSFPNLFNERKRKEYCSMSIVLPKEVQWRALPL